MINVYNNFLYKKTITYNVEILTNIDRAHCLRIQNIHLMLLQHFNLILRLLVYWFFTHA